MALIFALLLTGCEDKKPEIVNPVENFKLTEYLISGPDLSYFWILSRKTTLDEKTLNRLLVKAKETGFDISKFIYPDQSKNHAK